METIIQKDAELGKIRNHACENQSLSRTIEDYIQALEKLSFQNCPEEFAIAFKKHIKAWDQIIPLTNEYPDLRGEMHQLFNIIGDTENGATFKAKVDEIWSTWALVEKEME